MSRRHHGGRPHRQNGHARGTTPLASTQAPRHSPPPAQAPPDRPPQTETDEGSHSGVAPQTTDATPSHGPLTGGPGVGPSMSVSPKVHDGAPEGGGAPDGRLASSAGCTAPQLRRFIKSRPYVPMHELRRRFGINGTEDDVTPVDVDGGRVFVGLPSREGGLLGELLRGGEVGYELSMDPRSPVVVGLYPMRPIPRS